jgi:lysophospholipase L1-like esterase
MFSKVATGPGRTLGIMPTYPIEWNDPYCLGPDEAATLLAGAPWRRVLVMGDSIAAGIGDPVDGYADRAWADRLAAALGAEYLNLGRAGAQVTDVRAGQLDQALAFGPDLAVVAAGANDAFRRSFAARTVAGELEQIVSALDGAGSLVMTFGCFDLGRTSFLPPERRRGLSERLHDLGRLTEQMCLGHGGIHVDFLRHPALDDTLLSADRLHINRRGHAIVVADVIRALSRRLAAPGVAR